MVTILGAEFQILGLIVGFVIGAVFTSILGHIRKPE